VPPAQDATTTATGAQRQTRPITVANVVAASYCDST